MNPRFSVGVTGYRGLLGWHALGFLKSLPNVVIKFADRDTFADAQKLEDFVKDCDSIWHFAGMNRGDESEVAQTNLSLTTQLIAAFERTESKAHVLFSNSTHIARDTVYGQSKRECAVLLSDWALRAGGLFSNIILPNVFGEAGKPFYNSVVSTFCFQVARGEQTVVHQDAELEQVHAQVVARAFWDAVCDKRLGDFWLPGRKISVLGLLERIRGFHALYGSHIFPDVRDDFDRDLFNTYRSYLYPDRYPTPLTLHTDARGSLFEAVKTYNGGQTFLSTTKPGITRGNHYHTRKIERFLVVSGEAEIKIRRIFDGEVKVFAVSGKQPSYVDIPTLHTHNITNTGPNELVTLFWTHEFFDPESSDTIMEQVQ